MFIMQLQRDDSTQVFKQFIDSLTHFNISQLLQKAEQIYAVRQFKLSQLLPKAAQQIYQNIVIKQIIFINKRFTRNLVPQSELNWWENQLRIYVWTLVLYVHLKSTKVQILVTLSLIKSTEDWSFFSSIFPNKQFILFQYQSINILKEHNQAKKWTSQQDELFIKLVNEKGLKCKWSELAKLLYIDSEKKYFRTPKQCRERWLNHLDPSKSKSEWQTKEDFILIRYVYEKEKRWAQISKLLHNKRNQHSIKNRFKSLITKQLKFHKQTLSQKELIESIYYRYKAHLSKNNKNLDQQAIKKLQGRQKVQEVHENQHKNSYLPLQTNNVNRLKLGRHHSQTQMYPFTWHPKQQSFVPYRKSEEYFPFSNFQNSENNIKRNFITTYSANLDQLNTRQKHYNQHQLNQTSGNWLNKSQIENNDKKLVKTENNFFTLENHNINKSSIKHGNHSSDNNSNDLKKFNNHNSSSLNNQERFGLNYSKQERLFPLPNEHYEPDNHFYSDLVLNSGFGSSSQIQLGSNYEQFLPMEENESIEDQIGKWNGFEFEKVRHEMDEQERKIRAQIFLLDNPMDVVKRYFYHDKLKQTNGEEQKYMDKEDDIEQDNSIEYGLNIK